MSRQPINVVWFKCTDLRTHDHAALRAAHADGLPVLHLYVLDPFWYEGRTRVCGFPKTGVLRTRFQLEALQDLDARLKAKGHGLSLRQKITTADCFRELCSDYTINAVFAFHEICSEELRIQRQVQEVLREQGQGPLQLFWGYELLHHDDLPFNPKTDRAAVSEIEVFLSNVNGLVPRATSLEQPRFLEGGDKAILWPRACAEMPTVADVMGSTYSAADDPGEAKDPRAELRWQGGETAALAWLRQYLWDEHSLALNYVGATLVRMLYRSPMEPKATSKLSPWLAHGCLSPRLVYEEVTRYMQEYQRACPVARDTQTYGYAHRLIRELMWRDFTRFGSIEAGTSIFKTSGRDKVVKQKQPPPAARKQHANLPSWDWPLDQDRLQLWIDGRTGFPFVDSSMRELKATGYCKHVGRLCAGWFLISDLGLDWRMGGEWFESVLVDYEPCLNWFNWVYACLEPVNFKKPPRGQQQCLEILESGVQHDPDAAYIKRWLPELSPLPTILAREPWRLDPNGIKWAPKSTSLRKRMSFIRVSNVRPQDAERFRDAVPDVVSDTPRRDKVALARPGPVAACLQRWCELICACFPPRPGASPLQIVVNYPKPMIQPVSLSHAEDLEYRTRLARAKAALDRKNLAALLAGLSLKCPPSLEAWSNAGAGT